MLKEFKKKLFRNFTFYLKKVLTVNVMTVGAHKAGPNKDHVPIDGIVKAGRSTINESSFTSEPLPLTKLPRVFCSGYMLLLFFFII